MPSSHHKSSILHRHSNLDQPSSLSWSGTHASFIVDWLEEIPLSTSPSTTQFEAQPISSTLSGNEKALDESEEGDEAGKDTMSHGEFPTRENAPPDLDPQLFPQPASSSTQTSSPSESESLVDKLEGATPPLLYQSLESGRVEEVPDEAWDLVMNLRRTYGNRNVIPACFKV